MQVGYPPSTSNNSEYSLEAPSSGSSGPSGAPRGPSGSSGITGAFKQQPTSPGSPPQTSGAASTAQRLYKLAQQGLQKKIWTAIKENDVGTIANLKASELNQVFENGETPLEAVLKSKNPGLLEAMLRAGADPKMPTSDNGLPPIALAAKEGDLAGIELLAQAGAEVDQKNNDGQTALMFAAFNGNLPVVEKLLELGASPHEQEALGATAVRDAVLGGHVDVVECLARAGADMNHADIAGMTPLAYAAEEGNTNMLAALLKNGADMKKSINAMMTPLIAAARSAQGEAIEFLKNAGADLNQATEDGKTPLMAGLLIGMETGNWAGAEKLLSLGADPDQAARPHMALDDSLDTDSNIIGVNKEDPSPPKMTPLVVAAKAGSIDAIALLVDYGADINMACLNGETPLLTAILEGHGDAMELLLERGAKVDIPDDQGATPLSYTIAEGLKAGSARLLEAGANPDTLNVNGVPLLVDAAANNDREVVDLLLMHGANTNDGAAWFAAVAAGHDDIAEVIATHPRTDPQVLLELIERKKAELADSPSTVEGHFGAGAESNAHSSVLHGEMAPGSMSADSIDTTKSRNRRGGQLHVLNPDAAETRRFIAVPSSPAEYQGNFQTISDHFGSDSRLPGEQKQSNETRVENWRKGVVNPGAPVNNSPGSLADILVTSEAAEMGEPKQTKREGIQRWKTSLTTADPRLAHRQIVPALSPVARAPANAASIQGDPRLSVQSRVPADTLFESSSSDEEPVLNVQSKPTADSLFDSSGSDKLNY